eukprot:scaffold15837_cov49-Cyclotella_meneghiniana.AAC.1
MRSPRDQTPQDEKFETRSRDEISPENGTRSRRSREKPHEMRWRSRLDLVSNSRSRQSSTYGDRISCEYWYD